jgi:hypothetical protein
VHRKAWRPHSLSSPSWRAWGNFIRGEEVATFGTWEAWGPQLGGEVVVAVVVAPQGWRSRGGQLGGGGGR